MHKTIFGSNQKKAESSLTSEGQCSRFQLVELPGLDLVHMVAVDEAVGYQSSLADSVDAVVHQAAVAVAVADLVLGGAAGVVGEGDPERHDVS